MSYRARLLWCGVLVLLTDFCHPTATRPQFWPLSHSWRAPTNPTHIPRPEVRKAPSGVVWASDGTSGTNRVSSQ